MSLVMQLSRVIGEVLLDITTKTRIYNEPKLYTSGYFSHNVVMVVLVVERLPSNCTKLRFIVCIEATTMQLSAESLTTIAH